MTPRLHALICLPHPTDSYFEGDDGEDASEGLPHIDDEANVFIMDANKGLTAAFGVKGDDELADTQDGSSSASTIMSNASLFLYVSFIKLLFYRVLFLFLINLINLGTPVYKLCIYNSNCAVSGAGVPSIKRITSDRRAVGPLACAHIRSCCTRRRTTSSKSAGTPPLRRSSRTSTTGRCTSSSLSRPSLPFVVRYWLPS